jgi:hypothetical protein
VNEPITIGPPHWMHPRKGRVIGARLLVIYDDDPDRAVWYEHTDLPITVEVKPA